MAGRPLLYLSGAQDAIFMECGRITSKVLAYVYCSHKPRPPKSRRASKIAKHVEVRASAAICLRGHRPSAEARATALDLFRDHLGYMRFGCHSESFAWLVSAHRQPSLPPLREESSPGCLRTHRWLVCDIDKRLRTKRSQTRKASDTKPFGIGRHVITSIGRPATICMPGEQRRTNTCMYSLRYLEVVLLIMGAY